MNSLEALSLERDYGDFFYTGMLFSKTVLKNNYKQGLKTAPNKAFRHCIV
jgi:hypothetical protein